MKSRIWAGLMNLSNTGMYPYDKCIRLNNRLMRFHFSDESTRDLLFKPFSHLEHFRSPMDAVDFIVFVKGGSSSEEPLEIWRNMKRHAINGKVLVQMKSDRIHALFNAESEVLTSLNLNSKIGFYYIPDIKQLPYYEKAAPMRLIMHYFAEFNDMILVHGASVSVDGKAVILAGKGGSGKTTTAIASALSGLEYLGDDYVIIDYRNRTVHSLFCSAKIRWEAHQYIPSVKESSVNSPSDDKSYFFMRDLEEIKIRRDAQIAAIIIPSITPDSTPEIFKSSPLMALLLLSSSTIFQMPGSGIKTLAHLKELLQSVPVYQMTLSESSSVNAKLISNFLNDSSS